MFDKDAEKRRLEEEKTRVEIQHLKAQTAAEAARPAKIEAEINELKTSAQKNLAQGQAALDGLGTKASDKATALADKKEEQLEKTTVKIQSTLDSLEKQRFDAVNKGQFASGILGELGLQPAEAKTPEGLDRYTRHLDKRISLLTNQLNKLQGVTQSFPDEPGQTGRSLSREEAVKILKDAGGDPKKAEALAKQRGYRF
jgi:vacuolar-type H+-ATPase subunit I/STV1